MASKRPLQEQAEWLRAAGLSFAQVAAMVGRSVPVVRKWLVPKDRELQAAGMRRYFKTPVGNIKRRLYQLKHNAEKCGHEPCSATVEEILDAQVKSCPGCGRTERKMVIDHCHKTGKFRGWLCKDCNVAVGHALDNPQTLIHLAEYLCNHTR